jgi:peptidoglycan/xylan/chitin deacetylase (PgdA/CDA1 family)
MLNHKYIKEHSLNFVTYHYVRPVKKSLQPNLAALEFDEFKRQVDYFCNNFEVIAGDNLLEIINKKIITKKPKIILTFDDGYIDHYKYVFPYLRKKNISGYFYPPKKVIENKTVLDVNKIQFFLEKEQNRDKILKEIDNILLKKKNIQISDLDISSINLNSDYDNEKTVLIKKILQYFLPPDEKKIIIDELFGKITGENSALLAKKLYMNTNHVQEMNSENMVFGCHGDNHVWLEFLSKENQKKEILDGINFLKKINIDVKNISVCYPYGSYNDDSLEILKELKISFALTTKNGNVNSNNIANKFEYLRFDTNLFKL